jgi:AAA domain/DnaB-like helicase N terminal domain
MMELGLYLCDDAEQAVLGAALINDAACAAICAQLSPGDFFREDNREVFEAISRRHGQGRGIDQVTVAGEFPVGDRRNVVHGLAATCPSVANVGEYIARVRESARSRRWQRHAQEALRRLSEENGDGPRAFLEELAKIEADVPEAGADCAPVIDWAAFWAQDHADEDWVYPDVLARGRGHALYAAHKAGKSLLALYMAAKVATEREPNVVCYLDYEMTEADVFDRLQDMGYGAHTDLSRLSYALLPSFPPLDTPEGGDALMRHLDAVQAKWPEHHLVVVIDTIGRAIYGEENSADTFRNFYTYTGIRLKRRGATWMRLDHAGKDADRGQRGSSGKGDDVDVIWNLTPTHNGVTLKRHRARMSWVPERVTLRLSDSPLSYVHMTAEDWPEGTATLANILDRLEVPLKATRREASMLLKSIDEGRSNALVGAALRFRKAKAEEARG